MDSSLTETQLTEHWIWPDGIDEVLPPQAGMMERKRRELLDLYHSWGYEYVIPPFVRRQSPRFEARSATLVCN